jgi:short-subunit dehydrogenase
LAKRRITLNRTRAKLARLTAKSLVLYHRRAGGQSQYSALLEMGPKSDRIQTALAYARSNLRSTLTVEQLAEAARLSPRQFSWAFRTETGQSPAKAIEQLRLEAAKVMMEDSSHPVEVVAVADQLRAMAADLTTETGRSIEIIAADLTISEDVAKIQSILKMDASITMLVNNAGIGAATPLLTSDISVMEKIIALNVTALTRLSYAAARAFSNRGEGIITNLASSVAIYPEQLNGVYSASKAFVLAFSRSLHHELADKGIRVQVVLPGATATDFWDTAGMQLGRMPKDTIMSPEDVVDAAMPG